jgi:hypothetical protein
VLQEQPPVCVSQPHIAQAILAEARATDQLLLFLCKLENLQTGAFSEVRQKICPGPELSVLTSLADNQSFMRRPPRLRMQVSEGPPVKGGPSFYSDRDRNARWPIPSSLSDIPRAPCLNSSTCFKRHKLSSWLMFATYRAHVPTRNSTEKHWLKSWLRFKLGMPTWVRLADCETGQESILRPTFSGTTSVSETTRITQ